MKFDAGLTDVAAAGTRKKWSDDGGIGTSKRFLKAWFQAATGNTGAVYVGIGDVSNTHGWELMPAVAGRSAVVLELSPGDFAEPGEKKPTMLCDDIQFDAANNGDDVSWAVLLAE